MVEDVLIAYNDSSAETSRRFFQDCADRVRQKTCEKGLNHQMIDATELTVGHIEKRLSRCSAHFIFSAFSHGSKTSLYNDVEDEYIAVALGNNHLFTGNIGFYFKETFNRCYGRCRKTNISLIANQLFFL